MWQMLAKQKKKKITEFWFKQHLRTMKNHEKIFCHGALTEFEP